MRRLAAGLLLCGLLLASCGEEDVAAGHPQLLQQDDLPSVEKVYENTGPSASKTHCTAMNRELNLAITSEAPAYLEFHLKNGDVVKSTIQPTGTNQRSIDETLDQVRTMVDECVAEEAGTFERLTGLPAEAIGFRAVQDTSDGPQVTERAYARLDDEHAVVVTVIHIGSPEPSITVAELLPTAIERGCCGATAGAALPEQ